MTFTLKSKTAPRGQAMTEFAIILSLLFLVSVGTFYTIARTANTTLNNSSQSLCNGAINPPPTPSSLS